MTKNSVYNIKFRKFPNIQIDDSALIKQENIETEINKKLYTIDGIKDSNIIRQICLDSIYSANEEILIFFPTANSFLRYEKIGAIETLRAVVRQRNVGVKILVPHHLLIEKFVEQRPFLLETTCNIKTDKEDNINVESIRFIQETSGTRATILVVDKNILLVTELEGDIEKSLEAVAGFSTYSTDVSRIFPYISIFENLWAQAGLYHQVKKANEKLIMQDKKYKEFISVAAHELRTPIQPIIGLSYLLKYEKESLVGKEEESLDIIVRNAATLSKLAENILDLNKIENDNLMLKKEIFDLDKLILDVISDVEKQLALHHHHNYHQKHAKSKIGLRYHNQQSGVVYDEDYGRKYMGINALQLKRGFENSVEIEADKVRIYQVISNLINNAIKSIDDVTGMDGEKAGEIIISMRCANSYQLATCFDYQIDHNNGYNDKNYSDERDQNGRCPVSSDIVAIVSVTDTGRGIDLEILPRLFTRFVTSFKTGTGLGLFISRSIIEAHNGKIWAYNNKEGQGATFQFSLPLRK
ncbi:MAG TPA: HAMP domain-containing sensor histidine kinase [Nitrososphaeraceae archaeon]|nr:HAMP domain-containing sensor histidine kinase [Nitrososphaeraceae archaeon]